LRTLRRVPVTILVPHINETRNFGLVLQEKKIGIPVLKIRPSFGLVWVTQPGTGSLLLVKLWLALYSSLYFLFSKFLILAPVSTHK
jgi:hypothetical protein